MSVIICEFLQDEPHPSSQPSPILSAHPVLLSGLCHASRGFGASRLFSALSHIPLAGQHPTTATGHFNDTVAKLQLQLMSHKLFGQSTVGLPSPNRGHHFPICLICSSSYLAGILMHCFAWTRKRSEVCMLGIHFIGVLSACG